MTSDVSRGVYFLANDFVLEFAIAFLNSFRTYNPAVPLCLVPYDDDTQKLRRLADRYEFRVWEDRATLKRCDQISRCFHPQVLGQYRKLALWDGPFDEFLYIDTDTVVLSSVDFVFDFLPAFSFVAGVSDLPRLRRWVWKESIYRAAALTDGQIAFAANTGFLASHRGSLSLDGIEAELPRALALAQHMELFCAEQPLLNYLIVTSSEPHTSLSALRASGRRDLPILRWAGSDRPIGRQVLLVHWAGEWRKLSQGYMPHQELWTYYRNLEVLPRNELSALPERGQNSKQPHSP